MMTTNRLPMSLWAREDIPSVKADTIGWNALTNAELLSIIIGSGSRNSDAVEVSRKILSLCGNNLNALARMKPHEISVIDGIGDGKISRIMAAIELGRRRNVEYPRERASLNSASRIYNHFSYLQDLDVEEFWVSFLDSNHKLIKDVRIGRGGLTETPCDVRIVMREAVLCNAVMVVAVHNHPSCCLSPSSDDIHLTKTIKNACGLMRFLLLDHVIIGHGNYFSFHEQGYL